jgi:hypothetical protein
MRCVKKGLLCMRCPVKGCTWEIQSATRSFEEMEQQRRAHVKLHAGSMMWRAKLYREGRMME